MKSISEVRLPVHKSEFWSCPNPDPSFENWMEWGWNDYRYKARIKKALFHPLDQISLPEELSDDERERIDEESLTYKEHSCHS